jgi:phosphoglycolate phosphatase-like HAD superfamily hydrolase
MLKSVLFDVDGVLIDSFEANLKFFQNLFNSVGYKSITREKYLQTFHQPMENIIKDVIGSQNDTEVKRIFEFGKNNRAKLYPYDLISSPDGYESVINKLNQKYKLGIVTSRIRGGVFQIPQLAKVEKYFQVTVYFEDTQKHKPDPEPLLLAANKLDINPVDILYIGDTESDFKAAKAAGMKFILYAKTNNSDEIINTTNFALIPDLIATLI